MKYFGSIALCAALGACGATTDGGIDFGTGPLTAAQIDSLRANTQQLLSSGASATRSTDLRRSGTATYNGGLTLASTDATNPTDGLAGRLTLTANFAGAGSISGRATNFQYGSVNGDDPVNPVSLMAVPGTLTVSSSPIDRSTDVARYANAISGPLTLPASVTGDTSPVQAQFEGLLIGGFSGPSVVGVVLGNLTAGTREEGFGGTFSAN